MDPSDERKYMSGRDILEKYVDLDKSCLIDAEKKQGMDMLYKYKNAFAERLGSSRYEVLSLLDSKDTFHSLRLSKNSERYCGILPYFGSTSYLYQRMPIGLNISPSIWQSYINAILECLQSRKYCEVIMDDLLLFTPSKKSHIAKINRIVKGFT